ncbi:MAG: heat-inducible transcription repressor HrcA [Thermoleophilia bacterium]|nr:heat-inducible transcription repressor HrcA [Thermoleophilia bacterium]
MARLTERQQEILQRVVEEYVATGIPVGSKTLVERSGLPVSPSTVRSELAELEAIGLLTHPHTSAGRVPTEHGFRHYAERLLAELEPRPPAFPLQLTGTRSEVEAALEATTEMLSQVTRLLALVAAPPLEASVVRHVEVLLLQPQVVMAVVITSTGGVTKHVVAFDEPIDPGLAKWAHEYLNEQVAGVALGTHRLRRRLGDPALDERERAFLAALQPAFVDTGDRRERRVFVGGAAGLLDGARGAELDACQRLLRVLEQRATLLTLVGRALEPRRVFVRVGDVGHPQLRNVSLVGATYGLPSRPLGSVGLLGPLRMDYEKAIRSARAAALELSSFLEEVYADN